MSGQYRAELDHWVDVWNQMQDEKIIDTSKGFKVEPLKDDQANVHLSYITGVVDAEPDFEDQDLLQEAAVVAGLTELTEGKTANPVYPDSVGEDGKKPDAVWVDETLTKKVEDLRERLYKLENKLAEKLGGGDDWREKPVDMEINDKKPSLSEIESIRKQIDDLSSRLGIEDEPSPWKTSDKK